MAACLKGHLECVKLLWELESGLCDKAGQTALDYAIQGEHKDVIQYLRGPGRENFRRREGLGVTAFFTGQYDGWYRKVVRGLYSKSVLR